MLNLSGERTLVAAIIPPFVCHIDGIYSMTFKGLPVMAGCMASIPYDFYIKITGKANGCYNVFSAFPCLDDSKYASSIKLRALLLNSLTLEYRDLWETSYESCFTSDSWGKQIFGYQLIALSPFLRSGIGLLPLRTDYSRRKLWLNLIFSLLWHWVLHLTNSNNIQNSISGVAVL